MTDTVTIDLGETLDISYAAKLQSQLKETIQDNTSLNFVTDTLTRVDASCLQVLASFIAYAKENGIQFQWDNPSQVLKDSARLTGLTEVLELSK